MRVSRLALLMGALSVAPAAGQNAVDGHASVTIDHLPNAGDATEFRARVFAERGFSVNERLRFRLSGWAEGLLADRDGFVRDAAALPHEAYVEVRAGAFDVRAGLATSVWGRFDEVQPTDVVNPLDVSRYLFEGRSEARLPVLQTRLRWSANEATTVEGLWVPVFRRGRFDALDEPTSPFNLVADARPCSGAFACIQAPTDRATPPRTLASSQGGARVRTDDGTRGLGGLGIPRHSALWRRGRRGGGLGASGRHARRTVSVVHDDRGDFEASRGSWTLRGEAGWRVDDTLTAPADPAAAIPAPRIEAGRSLQAGLGGDRKAGDYRVNASILVEHRDAVTFDDVDVTLVGGGERAFSRDTIRLRIFGTWNFSDASGFARTIAGWNVRDNLWLEGSVGWFIGEGDDTLSRFSSRDFVYLRLKTYF